LPNNGGLATRKQITLWTARFPMLQIKVYDAENEHSEETGLAAAWSLMAAPRHAMTTVLRQQFEQRVVALNLCGLARCLIAVHDL
jgi:hypothetical protein